MPIVSTTLPIARWSGSAQFEWIMAAQACNPADWCDDQEEHDTQQQARVDHPQDVPKCHPDFEKWR